MNVTLERLPESRVQIDIEVEQERVDKAFEAAYRKLAPRTRVPGFRPGKAPRRMIEQALGRDRIMGEALDTLVPEVYEEALKDQTVDAIDRPALDKIDLDPVRLKFVVPVRPTVDLGDYRAIRAEAETKQVTDEMIAEQLLEVRRRQAILEPVERAAIPNDLVTADLKAEDGDEVLLDQVDGEFQLREGAMLIVEGLIEEFNGLSSGETKEVTITFPEDYRSDALRGKPVKFTITMKQVRQEILPDEDDDFAKTVSEEFNTIDELRSRVRENLQTGFDNQAVQELRDKAVDALVAGATLDFPALLIDREIDHLLRDAVGGDQKQYLTYLQRVGRSQDEFRAGFRDTAELRVKRSLALFKLSEAEQIDATADDVLAEIDRLASSMGEDAERFRQVLRTADSVANIRNNLISERTVERLLAIARGEAPELAPVASGDAEAAPAPQEASE
ncbi:MAG: trigger factor [Dehalococcoidia bacterium]